MKTQHALIAALGLAGLITVGTTLANSTRVVGGQTSVVLDVPALSGAGLNLSGVSSDVIVPGDLPESVAFEISGPGSANPSTFTYDPTDVVGSAKGVINHRGSVFFNDNSIELGDFTIGQDVNRGGAGFFVASTAGLNIVAFDVQPTGLSASLDSLMVSGGLTVSPELAEALQNGDLAGAEVGSAQVNAVAAVPTPTAAAAGLVCLGICGLRRRRSASNTREVA